MTDLYIGTYTGHGSEGIYRLPFEEARGALGTPLLAARCDNPSYLAMHPLLPVLYAVGEMRDPVRSDGVVAAYAIESDGVLRLLNKIPSQGVGPCHVSVDRAGRLVFVANYSSGSIAAIPTDASGSVHSVSAADQHAGSGPVHPRQSGPHAHCMVLDPSGRFVVSCDLGTDELYAYATDETMIRRLHATKTKAGSGPRVIAWTPAGELALVVNELDGTVTSLMWDAREGRLEVRSIVAALAPDLEGTPSALSEVAVHPGGRWAYVSVRDLRKEGPFHDQIVQFAIGDDGALERVGGASVSRIPRHFAIDPTGRWMIVGGQNSNVVEVLRIDESTGALSATGSKAQVGSPTCIRFARSR